VNQLDIHRVLEMLPHRYPFLLVDRVLDTNPETFAAIKNVTINEPFFNGHFPCRPVMPGVLIIEALAQASLLLTFSTQGGAPKPNTLYYFLGIDNARFKRPVEPGDQLILKSRMKRCVRGIWFFECSAFVGEELAASADIMCTAREVS
jgi:3-hydroxyacyl-[acyl-carrier-protein] dehydratase